MSKRNAQPSYRHHKPSDQAFVQWKKRRIYLGKFGTEKSREAYVAFIKRHWQAGVPVELGQPPTDLNVLELVDRYWLHAQEHYRRDGEPTLTLKKFRPALARLLELFGGTRATEFDSLALMSLRNTWVDDGLARITVNYYTAIIKQAFKWAAKFRLVPESVYSTLALVDGLQAGRTKAYDPEPIDAVDDDVVARTLPHVPAIVADMIRFQRLTGARPGEVRSMRGCDVQRFETTKRALPLFEVQERAEPPRELATWIYTPKHHKTEHHGKKHKRVIAIGPRGQEILRPYVLRISFTPEALCFPTARGGMYSKDVYNRLIARGCEIAFDMPAELREAAIRKLKGQLKRGDLSPDDRGKIEQQAAELEALAAAWRARHCWSPNQLRHAAATEIYERFGKEAAQEVLGHSREKTTEEYISKRLKKASAVMQEVG